MAITRLLLCLILAVMQIGCAAPILADAPRQGLTAGNPDTARWHQWRDYVPHVVTPTHGSASVRVQLAPLPSAKTGLHTSAVPLQAYAGRSVRINVVPVSSDGLGSAQEATIAPGSDSVSFSLAPGPAVIFADMDAGPFSSSNIGAYVRLQSGPNTVHLDNVSHFGFLAMQGLVFLGHPEVALKLDPDQVNTFFRSLIGYDPVSGASAKNPALVDIAAVLMALATGDGTTPAVDPSFISPGLGTITVKLRDPAGAPISSGAQVALTDLMTQPVLSTTSDTVIFANAGCGAYSVAVRYGAYHAEKVVMVGPSTTLTPTVTVQLSLANGTNPSGASPITPLVNGTLSTLFRPAQAGADGAVGVAQFAIPTALAVSGGTAYVADLKGLRAVDLTNGAVRTLILNGWGGYDGFGSTGRFAKVTGLAIDPLGRYLYLTDYHAIRRLDLVSRQLTTLAGSLSAGVSYVGGVGASARFAFPAALAVTPDGTALIIADTGNNRLRKLSLTDQAVTDLAGDGSGADLDGVGIGAHVSAPSAITVDSTGTYAYFVSFGQNVRRLTLKASGGTVGQVVTIAGGVMSGYAEGVGAAAAFDLTCDPLGSRAGLALSSDDTLLYVSDQNNHVVRQIQLATGLSSLLCGTPKGAGYAEGTGNNALFVEPAGLARLVDGNLLVVDSGNGRLRHIDVATGTSSAVSGVGPFATADGPAGTGNLMTCSGLCYDSARQLLYVMDAYTRRVRTLDPATGQVGTLIGAGHAGFAVGPFATAGIDVGQALQYDATHDRVYLDGSQGIQVLDLASSTLSLIPTALTIRSLAIAPTNDFAYALEGAGDGQHLAKIDLTNGTETLIGGPYTMGNPGDGAVVGNQFYSTDGNTIWQIDIPTGTLTAAAGDGTPGQQDGFPGASRVTWVKHLVADPGGQYLYLGSEAKRGVRLRLADNYLETYWYNGEVSAMANDGSVGTAALTAMQAMAFNPAGTALYFVFPFAELQQFVRKLTF